MKFTKRKIINFDNIKTELLLNIGFVFLIILSFFLSVKGRFIYGGDIELNFLYPKELVEKSLSVWTYTNGYGAYMVGDIAKILSNIYALLFNWFFSPLLANHFLYLSLLILTYFAQFILLKNINLFYFKNTIENYFLPVFAFSQMFNILFLRLNERAILSEILAFLLITLGLNLYINFLNKDKISPVSIFVLLLITGLNANVGHLLVFIFIILFFSLFHILKFWKNSDFSLVKRVQILKKMCLFGVFYLLLSAYWLLPFVQYTLNNYSQVATNPYILDTTVYIAFAEQIKNGNYLFIFNFLNYGIFGSKESLDLLNIQNPVFNILRLTFAFSLIFTLYFFIKKRQFKPAFFFTVFVFLIVSWFSLGAFGVFGPIYKFIVLKIPGFIVFRAVETKLNYFLWVLIPLLIFYFLQIIQSLNLNYWKNWPNLYLKKTIIFLFFIFLILPNFGYFYTLYNKNYTLAKIDEKYIQSIEKFQQLIKKENLQNGLILPYTGYQWATFSKQGFWGYSFFQQSSTTTGFHTIGSTGLNPKNYEIYVENFAKNADLLNIESLKKFKIDFLVVQKDFDYKFTKYYSFNDQNAKINYFLEQNKQDLNEVFSDEYFSVFTIQKSNLIECGGCVFQQNGLNNFQIEGKIKDFKNGIIFNQSQNGGWQITNLNENSGLIWQKDETNIFNKWNFINTDLRVLNDEETVKIKIYFEGQKYQNWGILFTIVVFILLNFYVFFKK